MHCCPPLFELRCVEVPYSMINWFWFYPKTIKQLTTHHSNQSCETILIICDIFAFQFFFFYIFGCCFCHPSSIFFRFDLHEWIAGLNFWPKAVSKVIFCLTCLVSYSFMNFWWLYEPCFRFVACLILNWNIFCPFLLARFIGQTKKMRQKCCQLKINSIWKMNQKLYHIFYLWLWKK